MNTPRHDVTALLRAWSAGDPAARDRLVPLVYAELRRRAAAELRRERQGYTLQPTALVHEAYLRLIDQDRAAWQDRAQFFRVASHMMRRILVDRARAHLARKRSGRWARVTLNEAVALAPGGDVDILDLDRVLDRLTAFDSRMSEVVELRFFGGLTLAETSELLGASRATVERDWQAARAWLFKELSGSRARND